MEIRLETNDGNFVHNVRILPFAKLPDIIQWGIRFFILFSDGEVPVYREGFATVPLE